MSTVIAEAPEAPSPAPASLRSLRVYDIPSHLPFLQCLAEGVLRATDAEGPDALSRVTILLPTRRATRALRECFLRVARGRALLLPRMRPLAGLSTEDADELALPALLDLPPAVDALRRQAVLASFVMKLRPEFGGPSSPEQAWQLAGELGSLLDEIALEGCDVAKLDELVPEEHARHWQTTLLFLKGVVSAWEGWLDEHGLLDIGARRVRALHLQREAWEADPPKDPIIAAGIGVGTTIPAAAELLRTVARLPRGAVVLHGADAWAEGEWGDIGAGVDDEAIWDVIAANPTHPFSGQTRLLRSLGIARADVRAWPCETGRRAMAGEKVSNAAPAGRAALIGLALRPAAGLSAWQERDPVRWKGALDGLSFLTAADSQQEAASIALLLREALEKPGATAALITPNRELARRVSAELMRHGVAADDSAGEPIAETPAGAFVRLVGRMAAEDYAPIPLLSVLKHPLCAGGWERAKWLEATRVLEREVLRGARPRPGIDGLREAVLAVRDLEVEPKSLALSLLDRLRECMEGFSIPRGAQIRFPATLLEAHIAACEALAATDRSPGATRLYGGDEGEPLADRLAMLAPALGELPAIAPSAWPALLDVALSGAVARSSRATRGRNGVQHPRVQILGLLEARLQTFDRVILGGLDETTWPVAADPGPWMSRPMRRRFGLPEPESRIGRVAADFCLGSCAAPEVILSRAAKRGGAPTVPARWITRLQTFLSGQRDVEHPAGLSLPASLAPLWASALDRPSQIRPCRRPSPNPPVEARPPRISVTEVSTLLSDPYAFYARRVLRLNKLEELDADVGASDYGILVHDALARFLRRLDEAGRAGAPVIPNAYWPADQVDAWFKQAAEDALIAAGARPGLVAFWRPRLARIGRFVIEQEAQPREAGQIARTFTELKGKLDLPRPGGTVELIARADRLDLARDGMLTIIDYKTGSPPSGRELEDGRAPQTPLEAAMAARGAFQGCAPYPVGRLAFWKLSGGAVPGELKEVKWDRAMIEQKAEQALANLETLVDQFLLGTRPFTAKPHPLRKTVGDDYDHLSRVAEWSAADEGGNRPA